MEDSASAFSFRKLIYEKYLTIEVMMYVEHLYSLEFMFAVNKETRTFIEHNMTAIKNGFVNEGLIVHQLSLDINGYAQLEKLYF
jgi:hypothetical protein